MKTKIKKHLESSNVQNSFRTTLKTRFLSLVLFSILFFSSQAVSAHCDSYDGPLIKDALKAIESNDVNLVLKWVDEQHEEEITSLFNKTIRLKTEDKEIYQIVEKHFLETLVRLHREGEGAPFTGLKPAGSASKIVVMADDALAKGDINDLSEKLSSHMQHIINEKFNRVLESSKTKDNSITEGRQYVAAYVEYTHYLETVHGVIAGTLNHSEHKD